MERGRIGHVGFLFAAFAVLLLSIGLMAAPLAGKALADDGTLTAGANPQIQDPQSDASVQEQSAVKYQIWVGGKQITSKNCKNVLKDKRKSVSYNPDINMLTLNNAKIKGAHTIKVNGATYRFGIVSAQDRALNITLKGKNTVSVTGKAEAGSYGIWVAGKNFSGSNYLGLHKSGSLKVNAGKAGLFSYGIACKSLGVWDKAKVTANGGKLVATTRSVAQGSTRSSYGVYAVDGLSLGKNTKLVATGKTKAIHTNGNVGFSTGYTLQVRAGSSAKNIKLVKNKPSYRQFAKYKYVQLAKAKKSSKKSSSKKPAKVKINSAKALTGSLQMIFTMPSKNCKYYQVQAKYNGYGKNYTWNSDIHSTKPKQQVTYTLKNLSSGITYKMRVRAINKVGSKKYYGAWSAARSIYVSGGAAG